MKENLEWCVGNTISDDHSENFGRCIYHSIKLDCQQTVQVKILFIFNHISQTKIFQGQSLTSFKLKHFELNKHLDGLSKNTNFTKSVIVYPILEYQDFYRLNVFFAKQRLIQLKKQTLSISKNLNDSWPPGQRVGNKPTTRFDVLRQVYFNMTHMFFPDDFVNVRKHSRADQQDVQVDFCVSIKLLSFLYIIFFIFRQL